MLTSILVAATMIAPIADDSSTQVPSRQVTIVNSQDVQSCQLRFDRDIHASYETLTVKEGERELFRILKNGDLYINGAEVGVNAEERGMLIHYKNGLTAQSEFVVEVMAEALEMTSYALSTTFTEMFGERHKIVRRIEALNETLAEEFSSVAYQTNDTYVVQGSQLDLFGDRLEGTLGTEIEAIVEDSMGSMIWMVTKAMFSGSGSFEERMEQFGERMEKMGENLETTMHGWGEEMEIRGEAMCTDLEKLREMEGRIVERIPSFSEYRLLM
ncbi:hypothetical protein CWE08_08130 [Aliidiomarina iranensis]|uniref:DUF2884 domain-containing protein n=1 Tax=Aliidiomarina iranensis TaxID=1434071 RepID=A0A432VV69_9GAMM|nr:DUF2884 family protein [Aliidiomarina iranensis]RUO20424.1 hypothetical protein CWE08_08130 [Aliidiomarina iranensis]